MQDDDRTYLNYWFAQFFAPIGLPLFTGASVVMLIFGLVHLFLISSSSTTAALCLTIAALLMAAWTLITRFALARRMPGLTGGAGLCFVGTMSLGICLSYELNQQGTMLGLAHSPSIALIASLFWWRRWQVVVGVIVVLGPPIFFQARAASTMFEWVQLVQLAVPVALAALFLRELAQATGHRLFQMSRELVRRAQIDGMTGLLNRSTWEVTAALQLEQARRAGKPTTLLLLDLDEFKTINDTRGHAAGDAALVAIARTLSGVAGPQDVVGRLGGDEFVILLPGSQMAAGLQMRDDIMARLRDSGDGVAASIGVVITEQGETLEHVMSRADHHMFQQKHKPRTSIEDANGDRVTLATQPEASASGTASERGSRGPSGTTGINPAALGAGSRDTVDDFLHLLSVGK